MIDGSSLECQGTKIDLVKGKRIRDSLDRTSQRSLRGLERDQLSSSKTPAIRTVPSCCVTSVRILCLLYYLSMGFGDPREFPNPHNDVLHGVYSMGEGLVDRTI